MQWLEGRIRTTVPSKIRQQPKAATLETGHEHAHMNVCPQELQRKNTLKEGREHHILFFFGSARKDVTTHVMIQEVVMCRVPMARVNSVYMECEGMQSPKKTGSNAGKYCK